MSLLGPSEPEIGCEECFDRLDEDVEGCAVPGLAPRPGNADDAMSIVGVVEVVAGVVVALAPRYGSVLVAGWLGGIIVNLLLLGSYRDNELGDFGLMLGALTLARLAWSEVGSTSRAQSRVFHS